jgi:hypothetical protein
MIDLAYTECLLLGVCISSADMSVVKMTSSSGLLKIVKYPIEQQRLASEKSKAVGSQQKRQRLCFRPRHAPPDTFGLSDRR